MLSQLASDDPCVRPIDTPTTHNHERNHDRTTAAQWHAQYRNHDRNHDHTTTAQ